MVGSQPTQDLGVVPPMEQILQMFKELKGRLEATVTTTQQSVVDLTEQVKQDRALWRATHDKLATLGEDYDHLDAKFTETKGLVEGSLRQIQSKLDQNKETVKQQAEILSLTCATVDEQTRRLDYHDTKLHNQQSASFFGSKNSLEKLGKFKEKKDQLSLRILEVEDWMRSQAPKNFALDPPGASATEGTSKYIPPNECVRANPKVGGQKTLYTPLVSLSSIIIVAMLGVIDIPGIIHLWKIDKIDFMICMGAVLGVSFGSVLIGLSIAVVTSLVRLILFITRPRTLNLGNLPETSIYRSVDQYPAANNVPGILILQIDSPIYFANANYLRERISRWIYEEEDRIKASGETSLQYLILDISTVGGIDTSGISMLE
ncbi:hypothetical protein ACLB2K_040994 [Fragaria x ananassa]